MELAKPVLARQPLVALAVVAMVVGVGGTTAHAAAVSRTPHRADPSMSRAA
jgi:hypothetical protein